MGKQMKKNLMSVLIMALVFVNVVLSAVIMITLVPATKQSNELITKVCTAIDLELDSGKVYNMNTIPVDQMEMVSITANEAATFNLKNTPGDKELHYAVANVSISLNTKDDDYAKMQPLIQDRIDLLKEIAASTFMKYMYEEVITSEGQDKLREEMLEQMQELFDSDFIVAVTINGNYQ